MQRPADHLHRATPIPSLESPGLGSRRTSGALSVGSIAEEEEIDEHDSVTSYNERAAERAGNRHTGKVNRLSPIPSGKAVGRRSNAGSAPAEDGIHVRLLGGLKNLQRKSNNSGPPSPTISEDSEGSGATFRSAESLHRHTPIPQDASSSYNVPGSFSRRSSGRATRTTPTINEFEGGSELGEEPDMAKDGGVQDTGRRDSLHRATPIPGDLLSSSSSLGRSMAHRPATPTIREDETQAERESDLDSNEHYYGAAQGLEDGGSLYATPRETHIEPLSRAETAASTASRLSKYTDDQAKQAGTPAEPDTAGLEDANIQPGPGATPPNNTGANCTAAASGSTSPSFSPFVESRDWERDILGVARFLRMCPGLSRQIIGDFLGENNERCLRVLECYTASFDFRGLSFEAALREYLEAFRLPGEAQKIYRILDTWSSQFFKQCPGIFKSADAVHVLAYSLVLLNTDLHNSQARRKMTCDEFVNNNQGLNAKEDFPREFLVELFTSIQRRSLRIPAAHPSDTFIARDAVPESIRVTQQRYTSPEKVRKPRFLCFK